MIYVPENPPREPAVEPDHVCPVCGEAARNERCKVVCRSETCTYRVILNCTEF